MHLVDPTVHYLEILSPGVKRRPTDRCHAERTARRAIVEVADPDGPVRIVHQPAPDTQGAFRNPLLSGSFSRVKGCKGGRLQRGHSDFRWRVSLH